MITTATPLHHDQPESEKEDNQGKMVVFQYKAMNDDQPFPNTDDQSETHYDKYEGFLDLDFMAETAIPLSVVYPDAYSDGEIP